MANWIASLYEGGGYAARLITLEFWTMQGICGGIDCFLLWGPQEGIGYVASSNSHHVVNHKNAIVMWPYSLFTMLGP